MSRHKVVIVIIIIIIIVMEPQRLCLKLILISLLVESVLAQSGTLSSGTEFTALLDLRSSLGLRGKDWPIKTDPCSWIGVQCRNGRVIHITVSGLRRTRLGRVNPRFAVESLANFPLLESFNASGFSLPGSIPDWFGQNLSALQVLDLMSASISGPIPTSLGNLSVLRSLYLSGNSLTGSIPSTIGQLSNLSVLDLSQNSLTGTIPSTFGSLLKLTSLNLASNFLSGPILASFGMISELSSLNLSHNSFSSSIPNQLGGLSQLTELDLGSNSLSGSVPAEFSGFKSLKKLVIQSNLLDGNLPDVIWSMPKLQILDISSNNFTGSLQNISLNGNSSITVCNLSNNLFYGAIAFVIGDFSVIDISGNYFQGNVSSDGLRNASLMQNCLQGVLNQRSSDDCRLFYSDRGLAFDNFGKPETIEPPLPENKKRLKYILAGLFGGIGFIVLLIFILVLILKNCDQGIVNQRGNANVSPVLEEGNSPQPQPPPKIDINLSGFGESYTTDQIARATNGFSESNLIKHGHSGDLYKGVLEGGFSVVIKKIDLRTFGKDSYKLEFEFLHKALHTRLVPLLGHCLDDENQKFLVYKYMPNGDLGNSLYFKRSDLESDSPQSLDWITRLKIAIGAAEALSYLHHECTPPLVHRDVQASSILLDDKFEVRLGSLSDVRTEEPDSHQNVITRLLRMPQTSEQGPSGSSATCTYDVYCFGKVLLELVTGKIGIGSSKDAKEWLDQTLPYISIYDNELVTNIIDPSLVVFEDLSEEVWAMAIIARSCLNPKPSKRPPMRYILKALENPLKVVRDDSFTSARLRTTSSRRSWNTAFLGSWRHSSNDSSALVGPSNREGLTGLGQTGRVGSHGSGGNDFSFSRKRLSCEIFPEPTEIQEAEPR